MGYDSALDVLDVDQVMAELGLTYTGESMLISAGFIKAEDEGQETASPLSNEGGELYFLTNQFGFAANFRTPPILLVTPPATLQDEGPILVMVVRLLWRPVVYLPACCLYFRAMPFAVGTRSASVSLAIVDDGFLTGFQEQGVSNAVESFEIGSAIPHSNGF
ncbi:MAG: hypothetical protein ACI8Z1_000248 [Candidatus Azotimanducaceae bacterium]|jgi:hypothetical protein